MNVFTHNHLPSTKTIDLNTGIAVLQTPIKIKAMNKTDEL